MSEGAEEKKEEKGFATGESLALSSNAGNTKQEEQGHAAGCSCPTCGATNFCVSCGSANEQYQMYAMQMKVRQPRKCFIARGYADGRSNDDAGARDGAEAWQAAGFH